MKKLASGKVPNKILSSLLGKLPPLSSDVIIPPGVGLDAAAIKIGEKVIAVTADPITFAQANIAKYSVSVNVNDIACLGCRPRWYTSVLLLPEGYPEKKLYAIWSELLDELKLRKVEPIGGHMEVTPVVNQPVLIAQMMGEPVYEYLLDMRNIMPGDKILLWRGAALEGTALLAQERFADLTKYILPEQLNTMQNMLVNPGICIWPAAEKLFSIPGLVAMHDPTEGGVATALHELADVGNCGLEVDAKAIPVLSETLQLADIFKFNPLGLLASGSLLIVCKPGVEQEILDKLKGERIAVIGELTKGGERILSTNSEKTQLPRFDRDEIIDALCMTI